MVVLEARDGLVVLEARDGLEGTDEVAAAAASSAATLESNLGGGEEERIGCRNGSNRMIKSLYPPSKLICDDR